MAVRGALRAASRSAGVSSIRIASVPAAHVYVQHLAAIATADGVVRLTDPPPPGVTDPAQWWPPAMLDPDWIRFHADDFDVMHVHFGFDALSAADLSAVADALDEVGKPLVYTVHDLRNPHHRTPAAHDAHLGVLIRRAAALITLTPAAAREIRSRWGRDAVVLPHPHVVDFDRMQRDVERADDGFVVGIHAKSLRASMDPLPVVQAIAQLRQELPRLRVRVNVHHDVADGARYDPELMTALRRLVARDDIDLFVHDCFTDDELWDYLQGLDLSVLPYRFGTHSGWLEACHDLGTAVLAPSCGNFAEQRPCLSYRHDESELDVASLQNAVRHAYDVRPVWRTTASERRAERAGLADTHRQIYLSVLR